MGNRIAELRKERGLAQDQLGILVDATRNQIKYWESGHVDLVPAAALADIFGVSLDYLAGRADFDELSLKRELVESYEQLNEPGRRKVSEYASDLAAIEWYRVGKISEGATG